AEQQCERAGEIPRHRDPLLPVQEKLWKDRPCHVIAPPLGRRRIFVEPTAREWAAGGSGREPARVQPRAGRSGLACVLMPGQPVKLRGPCEFRRSTVLLHVGQHGGKGTRGRTTGAGMSIWHWLIGIATLLGLAGGLYGLHRLALWLEDRGLLFYLRK